MVGILRETQGDEPSSSGARVGEMPPSLANSLVSRMTVHHANFHMGAKLRHERKAAIRHIHKSYIGNLDDMEPLSNGYLMGAPAIVFGIMIILLVKLPLSSQS
jgi:hypothetical protein